jgi:hypothetical protein
LQLQSLGHAGVRFPYFDPDVGWFQVTQPLKASDKPRPVPPGFQTVWTAAGFAPELRDVRRCSRSQLMKTLNWIRLIAALLLAAANSILPLHAGFGAAGAWILGTLVSALLFSIAGGIHRVRFMAVAVLPPFLVNRVTELAAGWALNRNTRSPSEALRNMFPDFLWVSFLAFGLFVAFPLTCSLIASHVHNTRKG